MAFSLSTLIDYQSKSTPSLTLFYEPVGERQQKIYRRQYPMYGDAMKFLTTILIRHGIFVEDEETGETVDLREGTTLRAIPTAFLIEGGAAILGWQRGESETTEDFSTRIEQELMQAYEVEGRPA